MSHAGETFFTSVGCMDGRVQEPILRFGQRKFGVKYADTITEAGLVGLLAKKDPSLLESVKKKVLISVEKHHSGNIVVHGHEECTGNPIENEQHKKETVESARIIKAFVPSEIKVLSVFVVRSKHGWVVEELE